MERKDIVIQVPVSRIKIGPLGFHRYASKFLRAAESLEPDETFSPVPYYLYCHSIELFLKAFLLGNNILEKELKDPKLGHHITRVLTRAKELGLYQLVVITSEQESEVHKADEYYSDKGFEYFQVGKVMRGYPDLPDIRILESLASQLEVELESFCWDAF